MARPTRPSPFPSTTPMAHGFDLLPVPGARPSTQRLRATDPKSLALDTTFTSAHIRLHSALDTSIRLQEPQVSLTDDTESLLGDTSQTSQHNTQSLALEELELDILFPGIEHESKVSPNKPWDPLNLVTASLRDQPHQAFSNLAQTNGKPHSDSGYAGSGKSQHISPARLQSGRSLEIDPGYTYDEPIDSVAQQDHFLPDQQLQQSSAASRLRRLPKSPPGSVVAETPPSTSIPRHFRCEECPETFNTKSEQSKHMARHERNFMCDYPNCARAKDGFATKNDLDRHKGSVHHDDSIVRKVYKCCVRGCKDPNKEWDRKDNFKAHVKRMHKGEDADKVVENSRVSPSVSATGPSLDRRDGNQLPFASPFISTPVSDHTYPHLYPYPASQGAPEDSDMYGPPVGPHQSQYPQSGQYTNHMYGQNMNLVQTISAVPSNFASSGTLPQVNTPQDPARSYFPSHETAMTQQLSQSQEYYPSNTGHWNQATEPTSAPGNSISEIDPSLHTLESGSWDQSSQPVTFGPPSELAESQLNPSLSLSNNSGAHDARRAAMEEHLNSILNFLPPKDAEKVKSIIESHSRNSPGYPSVNRSTQLPSKTVTPTSRSEERPFKCSREDCFKTFTHNNIKTKHEKRHGRLYFCTFDGCYSRFGSKDDLRRHEKRRHEHQTLEGWRCFSDDVPTSQHKPSCNRFFHNEDQFKHHRREEHKERAGVNNSGLKALKQCHVYQGQPGHFWCGFCNQVILNESIITDGTKCEKTRFNHFDQHITKQGKTMDQWIDLKSDGLTKAAVKARTFQPTDDSEDDDDSESRSTEGATPAAKPSSRPPGLFPRHLEVPPTELRGRKRSRSEAESSSPVSAKVPRTVNYQPSQQSFAMVRGVSDLAGSRPSSAGYPAIQRPSPQIACMICCGCGTSQAGSTMYGCANCHHTPCPTCQFFDGRDRSVYHNTSHGTGPGQGQNL